MHVWTGLSYPNNNFYLYFFLFFVLLSLCTIEILNIVSIYQRIYPLSLIRINIFTEKISQRIYFYA